jgi:hypothetical protein
MLLEKFFRRRADRAGRRLNVAAQQPAEPCHADCEEVTPRDPGRTAKRRLLLHVAMEVIKITKSRASAKCLPELVVTSYLAVNTGLLLVEIIADQNTARKRVANLLPLSCGGCRDNGSQAMSDLRSPGAIYVDADACPVKREVYRIAERHSLTVYVVSNTFIAIPHDPQIHRVVVGSEPDAADHWIAERVGPRDIVVTSDVPLASRCVKAGAAVIGPNGRAFTEDTIGLALATRNLMTDLRSAGLVTRGPKPLSSADRSKFLSALHEAVVLLKRTS